jgi:hypothetical protein
MPRSPSIAVLALAFLLDTNLAKAQTSSAYAPNATGYVAVAPVSAPEAGLVAQVTGTETFTYDTNPLLTISGAKPLAGSTTAPELVLTDTGGLAKLSADTTIDENVFDRTAFNSTDAHEVLSGTGRTAQWSYGARATADYDTTRTSEITTFGIDLPRVRHTGLGIAPQVSYSPSIVDKLTLQGSASTSRYDNNAFVNYDFYTLSPTYEHNFDPLNAGIFSIEAQRYAATRGVHQSTDSYGPSLGWLATLTPRLTLLFTSGFEETSKSGADTRGVSSGLDYVFNGKVMFAGLQDRTDVIVSRQQSPFSNGTEALLTSLAVAESHALSTRFSILANVSYENAQYAQSAGINLAAQVTAGGGIVYHALEQLDVGANYQYKSEQLTNIGGSILDHSVIISLTYRPTGAAL